MPIKMPQIQRGWNVRNTILSCALMKIVMKVVTEPGGVCPPGSLHAGGGRIFSPTLQWFHHHYPAPS